MTAITAKNFLNDKTNKELVKKILNELNGENYNYAHQLLDVVNFLLKENCFVDYNLAESQLDNLEE